MTKSDTKLPSKLNSPNQAGFISIFSILIIMAILSLVVVGFSALVRRAQRQVIDNQLSTQAFYAAESAVNDAADYLRTNPNYTKNSCRAAGDPAELNYDIDPARGVGYTCLLISSVNSTLELTSVPLIGTANPKTLYVETANGNPVGSFNVTWSATNTAAGFYPNSNLPPSTAWGSNYLGAVKIDLAPYNQISDRNNLTQASFGALLVPTADLSAGTTSVTLANGSFNQARVVYIRCTTAAPRCTARITLSGVFASTTNRYVARIQSVYSPVNLSLSGLRDTGGASTQFSHGQATIDATGKANDVFRRIQVRLPINASGLTPAFSLMSANSICKIMQTAPGETSLDDSFAVLGPGSVDDACELAE